MPVTDLLQSPQTAVSLLSSACMRVFQADRSEDRSIARTLDYFAYGLQIHERAFAIARAIKKTIGDQEAGDLASEAISE